MTSTELQSAFFKKIKENLSPHHALVDKVADLLNISNDSAYRRIRGEKALSFDEIGVLSSEFKISLDQFFKVDKEAEAFIFSGRFISREKSDIEGFVRGLVNQLEYFNSFQSKEIIYMNKDLPIFHLFMFPELASFKCYFWSRYNLNYPDFNKGQFRIADFINLFENPGREVAALYQQIPSTEIWNTDCINLTLHQIDYCRESKIFASADDVHKVYECLEKLVNHIERQVEEGRKFSYGSKPAETDAKYRVFLNEFVIGDNTVLLQLDDTRIVSLNHNVLNYVMTRDVNFVEYTWQTVQNIVKKSTLISEIGERDRLIFFDQLREKIFLAKKKI